MTKRLIYAVGDIHGELDKLDRLLTMIRIHASAAGADPSYVFLGDYVDRGADSRGVLERLVSMSESGEDAVFLKGNHEDMMLDALDGAYVSAFVSWTNNGGHATMTSYEDEDGDVVFSERHIKWMRELKLFHVDGEFAFVHAGILPGVPIEEQKSKDLLWIRHAFLDSDIEHQHKIIHGHTPSALSGIDLGNRICVDTGACFGGPLTCVIIDPSLPRTQEVEFLKCH